MGLCAVASPAAASGWLGEAGGAAGRDRGAGVVAGAIATFTDVG